MHENEWNGEVEGAKEHEMERARESARELLGRCEGTVASLAAQLALMVSPEYAPNENTVRTEITDGAGRGGDSRGRSSA